MIKRIYHLLKKKQLKRLTDEYADISKNAILQGAFALELRNPQKGRKYLTVGEYSVIESRFVFETEQGCVNIGDRVHIGNSLFISRQKIVIGNDVMIGWDCVFYDHNSHSIEWEERKNDVIQEYEDILKYKNSLKNKDWTNVKSDEILVKDKAWIGMGCKILKGVTIGEGAIIAAGSVVVRSVEPWTLVGGNPAKVIKHLREEW